MEVVDQIGAGLAKAAETAVDKAQRGVEIAVDSLDDLLGLAAEIRQAIRELPVDSPLRHVRPWVWRAETSGGTPLTRLGAEQGFEVRLSWYEQPL